MPQDTESEGKKSRTRSSFRKTERIIPVIAIPPIINEKMILLGDAPAAKKISISVIRLLPPQIILRW